MSFYLNESELDDSQRKILNLRAEKSLIVRGCAGSGKSVLAFWLLHEIVRNNKGTARIIVFTNTLKQYFEEGCRGQGIDPDLIALRDNWCRYPQESDYIIVDEAQDFSSDDIELLKQNARKTLLLFGDSAQQIFGFRTGSDAPVSMEAIRDITRFPMEKLAFNYRLPKPIACVAEYLRVDSDLVGRCRGEGNEKPFILEYDSREEQLNGIMRIISEWGLDDVGIIFPRNEQVRDAYLYFREAGWGVEAKYSCGRDWLNTLNFATTNPKLMTYHCAKGLQFGAVFLPECESVDGFVGPLYVAMTRAYRSLFIMYSGSLPAPLRGVPEDLYEADIEARETEVL
ncbi:UvrD-helicase domain-containing protein [Olsenella intestinalis]|uniref:UvrD-helicase domain-containing protein n=1 Tax=Olsenella intestinalis TaxID=2930083 RepID=UPI00200E4CEE|nr:ATP-binding protein [Olsenella intestinalis]